MFPFAINKMTPLELLLDVDDRLKKLEDVVELLYEYLHRYKAFKEMEAEKNDE